METDMGTRLPNPGPSGDVFGIWGVPQVDFYPTTFGTLEADEQHQGQ